MRHLLPGLLGVLLLFILTLSSFSLYKEQQVSSYQKRVQHLMTDNMQLRIEKDKEAPEGLVLGASNDLSKQIQIKEILTRYSNQVRGDVSLYYKNLTTDEELVIHGEKTYYMASLYKVVVTLYVLERVKHGEISLSDRVGNPALTLEDALIKIITQSNNEYAVAIAEKYDWKEIGSYIQKEFGIDFDFDGKLETNVKHMGSLFTIISEAIKLSDIESKYLLELLNHQTRLNKLPKYLPENIYSHNKTGELDQFSHDAGLFYTPRANYILIFMSKTPNPGVTNEQMAKMSKEIYDVLNN